MSDLKRKPHPGAMSREVTDGSAHDDPHDDMGRILTRRELIKLLGGVSIALTGGTMIAFAQVTRTPTPTPTGTAAAAATATDLFMPSCIAKPDLTEGPYFTDIRLNRSDIRTDPTTDAISEGIPLRLNFLVTRVDGGVCELLENVMVDVWHCDASGVYSNFQGDSGTSAVGQYFLRGYQLTDATGLASFLTIYPGWYRGRCTHIHFKMRTDPDSESGYEFTSQLFFDDALSDAVYEQAPYSAKTGSRLRNEDDGIYNQSGGQTLLTLTEDEDGGYTANFAIGLDFTAEATHSSGPGRGGRP